jgi:predicted ribosomally synthesized peptide with SipW-like signal peptide
MKTKMFMSMLVIALAAALVGGATMALFTDNAVNDSNTFTAGTVDVALGAANVAHVPVTITHMAPGDSHNRNFVVRNAGNLPLRFRVTPTVSGDLFTAQGTTGPATFSGVALYQNVTLNPNEEHTVDFTVALPITAGNAYQGDQGTISFRIDAVQLAHTTEVPAGAQPAR